MLLFVAFLMTDSTILYLSPQSTPHCYGVSRARIIDVAPVSFHQHSLPCVSHEGDPSSRISAWRFCVKLKQAALCLNGYSPPGGEGIRGTRRTRNGGKASFRRAYPAGDSGNCEGHARQEDSRREQPCLSREGAGVRLIPAAFACLLACGTP